MSRIAELTFRGACLGAGLLLAAVPGRWLAAEATVRQPEEALRSEPASPYRWCDLAEALAAAGERDKALYAMNRALVQGPNAAPILMRAVNFQVMREDVPEVLRHSARLLSLTPAYDGMVFSYFDLLVRDAGRSAAAISGDDRAAQAYLRYLMTTRKTDDAETVWNSLFSSTPRPERPVREYLDFLIGAGRARRAAAVWAQEPAAQASGWPRGNRVFNGDFEREPSGVAFDWRIRPTGLAEIDFDPAVSASGRSLRIHFLGLANLNFANVRTLAPVAPGFYRFRARVKTDGLTTDQGVAFRLAAAGGRSNLQFQSEPWNGTNDWTQVEMLVAIPAGVDLLGIEIVRAPSGKFDNKIKGTAWIDRVELSPAG